MRQLSRIRNLAAACRRIRTVAALAGVAAMLAMLQPGAAAETRPWAEILAAARGQTVNFNAWAGDEQTNAFIAWAGEVVLARHGVTLRHVKLRDTAEAVTRVLAERTAGRHQGGSVDLIWINGPNFLAMKQQGLLHGPFVEALPSWPLVDTVAIPSNIVDFTVPVDGLAAPWRVARVAFLHDPRRLKAEDFPPDMAALLAWARQHPGRLTHPNPRNFLGATFLKQALYGLAPDPGVFQHPADDAAFAAATAPLWDWYAALKPLMWRRGESFPEGSAGQRQLLADGEIDLMITFNPADAAVWIARGLLPPGIRVAGLAGGSIGNTSFVAIPYNAAAKEGAMVVAELLLSPEGQARMSDPRVIGAGTVLDLARLAPAARAAFAALPHDPALPAEGALGPVLLEPHPSWMSRLVAEWERRYAR
ncbi:MAG: ABC transporter substrate-binding protein [Thalassobaculales bacterium]